MSARSFDVIVVGAGPTGENVAGRTAQRGLATCLVESELVGGECSFWACIPSKALLRPMQALAAARSVDGARDAVSGGVNVAATLARRDAFVSNWNDASAVPWLEDNGIALLRGHGRLAGERCVTVTGSDGDTTELAARDAVVICTGSRAMLPPIPGLAQARPWTSRDATSARQAPRRLAILGGGVVACEMATAWRSLGCEEVVVIQRGPRLLPAVEPFAGDAVRKGLEQQGVRVLTGTTATRVESLAAGLEIPLSNGETLAADRLLVATGREPRTDDLGLDTVGLAPGAWIDVDDSMRVENVPGGWLYAAGDVNHRALLTHMGKYQGRICGDAIVARAAGGNEARLPAPWTRFVASASRAAVPQVIFTEPEVAAVGLTEEQARGRGLAVRAVDYELGRVSGASLYADGYEGKARIVVDESQGVIVGMTLVGPSVGEMIHAATIAVVGEVPLDRLWHAVPSFPTMSEVWLRLLETYGL